MMKGFGVEITVNNEKNASCNCCEYVGGEKRKPLWNMKFKMGFGQSTVVVICERHLSETSQEIFEALVVSE
jgi:hypothetical protein